MDCFVKIIEILPWFNEEETMILFLKTKEYQNKIVYRNCMVHGAGWYGDRAQREPGGGQGRRVWGLDETWNVHLHHHSEHSRWVQEVRKVYLKTEKWFRIGWFLCTYIHTWLIIKKTGSTINIIHVCICFLKLWQR